VAKPPSLDIECEKSKFYYVQTGHICNKQPAKIADARRLVGENSEKINVDVT